MLRSSNSLPHRLHSVALRYHHALARGVALAPRARSVPLNFEAPSIAKVVAMSEFQRDENLARLEAALFVAHEPLSTRKIAQVASLADATEARTLIRRLNQYYDAQASAFRAEQVAGGYQLLTRSRFGGWLRRWRQTPAETRLSGPAMETLAVVAYRQPVVRGEIEAIRGVQCGEILRQLMDRDLVRIVGRTQELGRPFLYGTTRRFLQWSGLRSLDELPRADALRRTPEDEPSHKTTPAARRDDELNPRNDLNEEPEVKIVASPESSLTEPWNTDRDESANSTRKPWTLAAASLQAEAVEDDDVEEEFDDDDDDDYDDDDDDDDLDDDEDLDDEDLEDEEWEEVDDEDDWDDEDEDWDEDDDEDEEDEDWDEE